ncbi:hypothetical protein TWF506_009340 [Arthrobotrys conoides]|uniref:Clr5 domain-containing protein n=1 Tax=Arthrobotrys conoides TaxID=74498 RepID=A0AAN8RTH8_9PEZI
MPSQQSKQPNKPAKISQVTWESYKSDISRLYLDERKTLDQVRVAMEENSGFIATKAQYIRMVNEVWRLKKNIKGDEIDCINTREKKRARDGKKTAVKLGSRQLDESELRRKRSRHHVSVLEQHQRRIAAQLDSEKTEPVTPEGIEIFTPTPSVSSPQDTQLAVLGSEDRLLPMSIIGSPQCFSSPGSMAVACASPHPSVIFEEFTRLSIAPQSIPCSPLDSPFEISAVISSPSGLLPNLNQHDTSSVWEHSDVMLLPREFCPTSTQLRSIISRQVREYLLPVALYTNLFHTTPGLRFSLVFENHLEEMFEGIIIHLEACGSYESLFEASKEYPAIQEVLSHEAITDITQWFSKVPFNILKKPRSMIEVIYFLKAYMVRLANKIDGDSIRRRMMDELLKSGLIEKHISILEMIFKKAQLRKSSPRDTASEAFIQNLSNYSTGFELVVDNFATELLYSAARIGNMSIIKLILRIGIFKEEFSGVSSTLYHKIGTTAIQYAIEYGNVAIYTFLLHQGFDVNVPPASDLSPSLLWTAMMFGSPDLVSDLLHVYHAVDSCEDFDFTKKNHFLIYYADELTFDRNVLWDSIIQKVYRYKQVVYENSRASYKIKTALQLGIAEHKSEFLEKILPSILDQRGLDLLGSDGLSSLLIVALTRHDERHWMAAERIANHTLWGREVAPQNIKNYALSISIQKMHIPCIKTLLKHGADIHSVSFSEVEDGLIQFNCIKWGRSPWLKKYLPTSMEDLTRRLRLQDLTSVADYLENCRHRSLFQKNRENNYTLSDESVLTSSLTAPVASFKRYSRYFWAHELQLGHLVASLENLLKGYSPVERGTLRTQIILISTLSESLEMYVSFGSDPNMHTGAYVGLFVQLGGLFQASCYFEMISKLFSDIWSEGLDLQSKYPRILITWALRDESDLEKIKKTFNLYEGDYFGSIKKSPPGREFKPVANYELGPFPIEAYLSDRTAKGSTEYITGFEHATDFVRCTTSSQYQQRQCALLIEVVPLMSGTELLSLLRLAVHCDAFETVQAILKSHQKLKITQEILHEAAWFARPEIFDMVVGQYWILAAENENANFELVLLAIIIAGNLYKLINILPFADIDHDYGRERTPLGVAAYLGRLDICRVLLESGASRYLSKYEKEAGEKGHFAVQTLLQTTRVERAQAQDMVPN